jgi:arylsulfatase
MAAARNILVVVLSGGRADRLSCSGYDRETTPFLDQMAREGVRFTQAYTTAPRSASACASILTGLFASAHGATSESGLLPPTRRLLSEQLAAAGYRTAAFCSDSKISPATGFGRGFDRFHTRRGTGRIAGRAADYARRASDRVLGRRDAGARRTNLALLDWVGAAGAPFFAFVRYDEARLRLRPPAPYDRLFMPREFADARIHAVNQDPLACLAGQTRVSSEDARILEALYDGALRYLDMRLKELVEALERLGRWENTLLVVTADHGQLLGEHGLAGHRHLLYEEVLHVPLIVRCPGALPQGFVVEEIAQHTDLLATVVSLAGIEGGNGGVQHGRALLRDGRVTAGPDFAIAEDFRSDLGELQRRFPSFDTRPLDVRRVAIRTRREKYVWHSDECNELYDLVQDPREERNRVELEAERADRIRRRLFDWVASTQTLRLELGEAPNAESALGSAE